MSEDHCAYNFSFTVKRSIERIIAKANAIEFSGEYDVLYIEHLIYANKYGRFSVEFRKFIRATGLYGRDNFKFGYPRTNDLWFLVFLLESFEIECLNNNYHYYIEHRTSKKPGFEELSNTDKSLILKNELEKITIDFNRKQKKLVSKINKLGNK